MKNIRSAINIPAWASAAKESGSSGWGWKVPAGFGLASLALAACTTPANAPAEIRNSIVNYCSVSQTDIDEQIAAGTPISYYIDLTPECIGEANQREIADIYGGKVTKAGAIIGLKPNPNDSNIKLKDFDDNKQVDFFIYHLDNGKDIGVFPGMGGDYNKSSLHEVNTYISPNDKDKTIEYSWGYRDPNNEDTAITFFTVSLPNSNNLTQDEILNQYISNPNFIGSLGSPTRIILSNPSSKEEIIIDLKPGNTWIERLLDATITGVAHAQSLPTKTPPPLTEIPPTVTPLPPTKIATATDIPITTYSIEELNAMSSADKLAIAPQVGTAPADVVASFLPKGADVADVTWGEKSLTYWERVVSYHGKAGGQEVALYYDLESGQWAKKYESFESLSQIPASQVPDVMVLGDRLIHVNPPYEDGWVVKPPIWTEDGKQIFRDEKGFPRVVFDTANKIWLDLPDYPVFDQAENILTPEKLPAVPIEKVLSGEFAEIVLRMYHEGKIRQISPDAKPYPFQWGNKLTDREGIGQPMSMYMTRDEKFLYEQNLPYTFALLQSEFLGEKVVLAGTIWLNKDETVSVMPQTIPFSLFPKWQNETKEDLTGIAPTPGIFKDEQTCMGMGGGVFSQEYCQWQMSVQDEWLGLVKTWVETGIMPSGLSRYPLHNMGGTTTYFTD